MNCPHCKTQFHDVIDTHKAPGVITRTRQCFNGHKFRTQEQVLPPKSKQEAIKGAA